MQAYPLTLKLTYTIVGIGLLLVLYSAFVPHFSAGYRLAVDLLVVGALPYTIVGVAAVVVRGWTLLLPAITLVVDIVMRINGVVLTDSAYSADSLYSVPILLSAVVLPLAFAVGVYLDRRSPPTEMPSL
ncbi:MAG: hypothetical protein ACFCUJ_01045 [Thiotrichales bacterium]